MRYRFDDIPKSIARKVKKRKTTRRALGRFKRDPFVHGEILGIIEDAEMMGIDIDDPEMMGGIVDVVKKIAGAIKKRRQSKKSSGSSAPTVSVQTSQGTAALGPAGLSWTGSIPQNIPIGTTGMALQTMPQQETILDKIKANPALLAGIAAVPIMFMLMSRKKEVAK